jgi:predicted DsbA family dithiol-disulfide isomerase
MIVHLKRTASDLGLPFGPRAMTYNSRLAQELGLWAASLGQGREFNHSTFYAYFVAGKNLAKKDVLLDICSEAGLPVEAAAEVIASRSFSAAVDSDWQAARDLRVTAVPTFILGGNNLVGAQPYEALEQLVLHGGAAKRW